MEAAGGSGRHASGFREMREHGALRLAASWRKSLVTVVSEPSHHEIELTKRSQPPLDLFGDAGSEYELGIEI